MRKRRKRERYIGEKNKKIDESERKREIGEKNKEIKASERKRERESREQGDKEKREKDMRRARLQPTQCRHEKTITHPGSAISHFLILTAGIKEIDSILARNNVFLKSPMPSL